MPDNGRFIAFDRVRLGKSKIIADTDDELVVNAVLASELVHKYADGMAYKPGDELEKTTWTMDWRWVKILDHPAEGTIQRISDISGRVTDVQFLKNLTDPKTGRPNRKGVVGDIHFFKHVRGKEGATPVPPEILEKVRSGDLSDVSIGFTFEKDPTPGEFDGMKFDYVQRNLFFDHVAAPVAEGRCPTPLCGIGVDSVLPGPRLIGLDPWEEGETYIRSGHGEKKEGMECRTTDFEGKLPDGIKAVYCHMPDSDEWWVQSYLFDKGKFTMEEAKKWLGEHKGDKIEKQHVDSINDIKVPCPICDMIKKLGELEFSKRLVGQFGLDAVLKAVDAEEGEREKAKKAQEERASKYGIGIKEGGNVTKPSEFENIPDDEFADPVNYAYPMDPDHVMAAWAYISKPENREKGGYTEEEWNKMVEKVRAAMEKHGHEVAEEDVLERSKEVVAESRALLEA